MQYDGYRIGPVIRNIRADRHMTVDQVSEITGLSNSSINQIEQGGRNLSMRSLFLLMDAYGCDANTVLDIKVGTGKDNMNDSIDRELEKLPVEQRNYLITSFKFMIDNARTMAV